jgi:hypothetical protein
MRDKLTISKKITTCYEYVDLAERAALNGSYQDSNLFWRKATDLAIYLLDSYDSGSFLDEEYYFLKQIAKHFKDHY